MRLLVFVSAALAGLVVLMSLGTPGVAVSRGVGNLAPATAHPDWAMGSVSPAAMVCSASALCPSMLSTAYGFGGLLTNQSRNGTGQSIVIIDACGDSKIASDLAKFDSTFHLAAPKLTVYTPQGTPCRSSGWSLETALDVEWSHAVAPGAAINLVVAARATTTDLYGAWNYSLTHSLGNQISNSWGATSGCGTTPTGLLKRAATANVTVLASSGDSGAWGTGQSLGAQAPADCPGVLTVGGTTLSVSSNGTYTGESAWSGSGGGYTPSTTEPSYQVTAGISNPYGELGKPDVAAVADPSTGVWVYNTANRGWVVVGGTSVACPLWAGFAADANSWRAANGFAALGTLDSYLYLHVYGPSGGSANYSATFHDVTSGSNGWSAGTGWDAATGLGSFRATALATQLGSDASA